MDYAGLKELGKDALKSINFVHTQVVKKRPILATIIIYLLIFIVGVLLWIVFFSSNKLGIENLYFSPEFDKDIKVNDTYLYNLIIELEEAHDVTVITYISPYNLNKIKPPRAYINESKTKYNLKRIEVPVIFDTRMSEEGAYYICVKLIDNLKSYTGKSQEIQEYCQHNVNVK